jgi:putative restriction endonuclease
VRFWVGLTDKEWYDFLAVQPAVDEVNFWQPGDRKPVALTDGAPFLFKLHKAQGGWIVGGGYWAHYTSLPARLAWDVFGQMNGAATFDEMARRIRRYRPNFDVHADRVGCVALVQPFFLAPEEWVEPPADWKAPIQRGRTYDTAVPIGGALWERVEAVRLRATGPITIREENPAADRYGTPMMVAPRLGQGTFRAMVIDAYERRCAVTGERTLPVLEAAHIKPYSSFGPHATENGLLLRSDLHTLFDRGYLTVTPKLELRVSHRIRDEYENGRDYYAFDRHVVRTPVRPYPAPSAEFLEWHGDVIFRS